MSEAATAGDVRAAAVVRPGSFRAWVLASRPATLTAAFVPVLVGTAVAQASGGAPEVGRPRTGGEHLP